jgi:hypothetical protein
MVCRGGGYLYSPRCGPMLRTKAGYPRIVDREQDLGEIEVLDCSNWKGRTG